MFILCYNIKKRKGDIVNKFYNKSELGFAIFWIVVYILLASIADSVSLTIGVEKCITSITLVAMSVFILLWIIRNNHINKYGLCKPKHNSKYYLYYIPLIIMISINLWLGFALNYSIIETVLFIISMLCVGLLEEIIFRGFLFKAMAKDNLLSAIIVSSVTFGIGHIINLFSGGGESLVASICQVFYAMAAGFLFVVIFYRGGSLIPCIITHSLFNALSCFMNYAILTPLIDIIISIVLIVLNVGYALVLLKTLPKENIDNAEEDKVHINNNMVE